MGKERQYIAIDLKSFYASVECVERGLNPLDTCLVVADGSRTEKTICLAVSPALKAYGIPGRPRLFEVVQRVREINRTRGRSGKSFSSQELVAKPDFAVDYLVAPPRMQLYVDYSTRIYDIYLRYIAAEDIHVYSIDEVFIDATTYLDTYRTTAHDLAMRMIRDVLAETGITATAGIGTNMYLCKIAMDIVAKKMEHEILIKRKLPYKELLRLYSDAIALIIPLDPDSEQDKARFSQKIAEYTSSKTPIITNWVGEIPYYFHQGKDVVIAQDYSEKGFSDVFLWCLSHKQELLEIGYHGYQIGKENFNYKKMGIELFNFKIIYDYGKCTFD